jgi:NADH dehydrogenase
MTARPQYRETDQEVARPTSKSPAREESGPEAAAARAPAAHASAAGRRPHVVIVGAGFGGLAAARKLSRAAVDITVIDRHNHHLFQPLLYQVATAALSPAEIAVPIRAILHDHPNVQVLMDEVAGVDVANRHLLTRDGAEQNYDYLILATGAEYNYFGHGDWPQLAPGLKTLEDAEVIRTRLLFSFEKAETIEDEAERRRLLTFVLIGGGPTGVEMAGAVAELARSALARDFRSIDPASARILLIEAGPRLLNGFPDKLSDYTRRALERLGVEVRLGTPIDRIEPNRVVLKGGETIPAATVIWCAGVKATPVGAWIGAETARNGGVKVADDLSVPAHPEIFVVGDAAAVTGNDGRPLPGVAPVAKQEAEYVAEVIRRRISGEPPSPRFAYKDEGSLATIGRSAAVADFHRFQLTGFVAWVLWGIAHIFFLIGFRNRAVVFVNWIWSWLTYGRGARLIIGDGRS